ncbi:membrane protein [Bifidobacterium sp. UTCIF-37]|uniref:AI-2E family transporter n=1 Tax=unclassified Bifidobacterium TaxID=2608897 RepID=UPI00112C3671|nr:MULTISPECIES: AI-2E family transporter [unclassified Bifidobacterium]TPF85768.1 membrane protein [Bifidobacterium sp. UTCIF-37]TPF87971.1 membrane protein [Bifidobacterium sp. UTCIF-38]
MSQSAREYGSDTTDGNEQRWDFGTLFPAKGDPRRPPEWFGRGLLYIAIAVIVFAFCWRSWGQISYLVLDIIISLFLALAVEPMVISLVRHGWKRGAASAFALVIVAVVICVLLSLFGSMFVQQVVAMLYGLPSMYEQIKGLVSQYSNFEMPEIDNLGTEILKNIQTSWVTDFAGTAMSTVGGLFSFLLNLMTVVMTTYYISAAGPKLRRSFCQWMAPAMQRRFLLVWTVAQDQISSFLFSRSILAMINAACTAIFLEVLKVPYWLPLALFCGVVSQFIPTVGTYIGGALPVLFALGSRGWVYGVAVLVFIIVYQQIENLILSPKISQSTMDINAAIAFLAVLAFGSVFGALGAFLALPVTASLQTIFRVYTRRYELVDSPLMYDPEIGRKSKVVEASEAFSEHVLHPLGDHMPRAARGSTNRVPMNDEIRRLQEEIYAIPDEGIGAEHGSGRSDGRGRSGSGDPDESATVAIPKGVLDRQVGKRSVSALAGTETDDSSRADRPDPSVESVDSSESDDSSDVSDNPRAGWR